MTEVLTDCLKYVTEGYFIRQVIVITLLAAAGFSCNLSLLGSRGEAAALGEWGSGSGSPTGIASLRGGLDRSMLWSALLAFPLGLALYSVGGFAILLLGLPFNGASMAVLMAIIPAAVFAVHKGKLHPGKATRSAAGKASGAAVQRSGAEAVLLWAVFIAAVVLLALICTSGLLSVTIDNDSVYYYSTYPEIIAREGRYLKYFDTFMTDVGQTSAVLNTLPFLYGFDNTFGIQHFMNVNFVLIFAAAVGELAARGGRLRGRADGAEAACGARADGQGVPDAGAASINGRSAAAALFSTLFLVGTEPFVFISKWVMSNVYFMIYLCIILFLVMKLEREREAYGLSGAAAAGGEPNVGEITVSGYGFLLFVFTAMLSMLRVEGVVVCAMTALCLSTLNFSKKTLALVFVLPVLILQTGFYAMLYLRMGVDPVYSFLDIKKALAITLALAALLIFILFIRDRLLRIKPIRERLRLLIILVIALGNAAFLAVNSDRYLSNLLTIYRNIRLGHGWGYFGLLMLASALLIAFDAIRAGLKNIDFMDFFWVCFILTIIASCWARGGALRMGVGDSGNRIMMETVPLTVVVLTQKCYHYIEKRHKET